MADMLVQQPTPQPSEVPPAASVPPVMSTPPVMSVPPSPISQKVEPPKSKIGLVVAGVVALVMMVGVGVWGYSQFSGTKTPQIAKLTEDAGNGITITQTEAEEKEGKGRVSFNGEGSFVEVVDIGIDFKSFFAENNCEYKNGILGGANCNLSGLREDIKAESNRIRDESFKAEIGGACASQTYIGSCAGSKGVCSDGVCVPVAFQACNAGDSCPVQCTPDLIASGYTHKTTEPGGGKYCDDQGRECSRYREELMTTSVPGTGTSSCFLGYGEQCGEPGQCGPGTNVRSPSPKPSVPASPNPSPSPTMACTGLTQTPATQPVVGSKLTFTCAGSVTPSNASTLSYNFRYAINNGAWVNLTNKTTTTAELTISSCGTYKVECRACATFGGLIKCDPFWQYAGVQPL